MSPERPQNCIEHPVKVLAHVLGQKAQDEVAIAWRKDGPIQKYFAERVLPEFLATHFDQPGEKMQFVGGLMSRVSIAKMHELMETLAR